MKKIYTDAVLFFVLSPVMVLLPCITKGQLQVSVGTGIAISVFSPLNRTNDYSVYEVIYLASDIATTGNITHLAFERVDGDDTATIQNVDLYIRHTSQTQQAAGTFDTSGYTHVYTGTFPNDIGSGWREVALDTPFMYNGTDHLEVLTVKGYQAAVAGPPVCVRWYYTNITPAPARARRYYGSAPISTATSLTTTQFTSNVRLTFDIGTGSIEIIPGALNIFPNPAQDELSVIGYPLSEKSEINIYNALGESVFTQQQTTNYKQQTINIRHFLPGIYVVKVLAGDKIFTRKIVKL